MATKYMDPARVEAMGQGLQAMSMVLKGVAAALEMQMMVLRTTAFIGLVGGFAVERYLASIKPQIEQLAKLCEELSQDALLSAKDWRQAGGA